jgi:NDP-sugar pyrophosphorylase family protein
MASVRIEDYVRSFQSTFSFLDASILAWQIPSQLPSILERLAASLSADDYRNSSGVLVHDAAIIESGAILKPPAVISEGCFVAATAYIRGGVFLDRGVIVGPGCELKTTIVMSGTTLAHFNFVGDSIVGSNVNMEAGAVVANHYNERTDKEIKVFIRGQGIRTGVNKFGAVIGDRCRVGANAVLSPGTVLEPNAVVARLVLISQGGA